MAEDDAPPVKAAKGIGGGLTRKLGPLPIWAWGAGAAALAFLVYRYISSKSASATPAASTASPTDLAAGTSSTPGSNGYQDNGQLTQLSTQLQGISDLLTQTPKGTSAAASTAGYSLLSTVGAVKAAKAAGQSLYEQVSPGVFTIYKGGIPGANLPSGTLLSSTAATPLYAAVNGSISGAGGSASPGVGTAGPPAPVPSTSLGGIAAGGGITPGVSGGTPYAGPTPISTRPLVGGPAQGI